MKKARFVEIPEGVLDKSTYDDLRKHAMNSSIWYVQRYPCHSSKLKNRLYEKGYPRDFISYKNDEGEIIDVDLVEDVISELKDLLYVDDSTFVENKIESEVRKGKGISAVKNKLSMSGVPRDEIEEALDRMDSENLNDEIMESLDRAFKRILRSSKFRKAEGEFKKRNAVTSGLFSKGFSSDDIYEYLDENVEDWESL